MSHILLVCDKISFWLMKCKKIHSIDSNNCILLFFLKFESGLHRCILWASKLKTVVQIFLPIPSRIPSSLSRMSRAVDTFKNMAASQPVELFIEGSNPSHTNRSGCNGTCRLSWHFIIRRIEWVVDLSCSTKNTKNTIVCQSYHKIEATMALKKVSQSPTLIAHPLIRIFHDAI